MENPCAGIKVDEVRKVSPDEMARLLVSEAIDGYTCLGCGFYQIKFKKMEKPVIYEAVFLR